MIDVSNNISSYFKGNFYLHFNKLYYIFEGFNRNSLIESNFISPSDMDDPNKYEFLKKCSAKIIISDNQKKNPSEYNFDLSKTLINKNFLEIDLDYLRTQDFNFEIKVFYDNKEILNKEINLKDLLNEYNEKFSFSGSNPIKIEDLKTTRIIFVIKDLMHKIYPGIDFARIFCLNCSNEDLNNIYKKFKFKNFYCIHKMNKQLNFKFLDYKIYSNFLSKKNYKDNDIIIYKTDYKNTLEYDFDYKLIGSIGKNDLYNEKRSVSGNFYLIKDFLNNVNYTGILDKTESIDSLKRKIIIKIQEFPKLNSKNYFTILFQQNLNNIK